MSATMSIVCDAVGHPRHHGHKNNIERLVRAPQGWQVQSRRRKTRSGRTRTGIASRSLEVVDADRMPTGLSSRALGWIRRHEEAVPEASKTVEAWSERVRWRCYCCGDSVQVGNLALLGAILDGLADSGHGEVTLGVLRAALKQR